MTAPAPGITSIACGAHLGQAASVRGQSNQVLSEVLRAGRESTAELSPLSTPESILMCYQKHRKGKHLIIYPRNNPEIAANGQGCAREGFSEGGERTHHV